MTPAQRRRESTAFHEAGHVYMAFLSGLDIQIASIVPLQNSGSNGQVLNDGGLMRDMNVPSIQVACGHCAGKLDLLALIKRAKLRNNTDLAKHEIRGLFAGDESVRYLRGRSNLIGASDDYARIQLILDAEFTDMDVCTRRAIRRALQLEARDEIARGWRHVTALAQALLCNFILTFEEIQAVIDNSLADAAKDSKRAKSSTPK